MVEHGIAVIGIVILGSGVQTALAPDVIFFRIVYGSIQEPESSSCMVALSLFSARLQVLCFVYAIITSVSTCTVYLFQSVTFYIHPYAMVVWNRMSSS